MNLLVNTSQLAKVFHSSVMYLIVEKIIFQPNQDELLLICFDQETNNLLVVRIMYSDP